MSDRRVSARHLIDRVLDAHWDRPFLVVGSTGERYTYAETYRRACQLATELHGAGVRRQDRIACVLPNSVELATLYFACLFLGAVVVPINPDLHADDVEFALSHSGARLIVCSGRTHAGVDRVIRRNGGLRACAIRTADDPVPDGGATPLSWPDGSAPDGPDRETPAWFAPGGLFSITFTSGTTSLPKAVVHRSESLLSNAASFNAHLGFGPQHRFLHVFPMSYMAGLLNTLISPFMAGGSVVIVRPFEPRSGLQFWKPVIDHDVNTLWLSPSMLAALVRIDRSPSAPDYCRTRMRRVCVGTAPLPPSLKTEFEAKYGVPALESYGLSELLFIASNSAESGGIPGSVGTVLENVVVKVVDDQGASVPVGREGEICVKTPHMQVGYLDYDTLMPVDNPDAEWFQTGDVGVVDLDGRLFITARKKDLIIRGGVNVSPRKVEETLLQHEAIRQAAVIGLPHTFYGEEIVAVVAMREGRRLTDERAAIAHLCRQRLAPAFVPDRYLEVDELPVSTTGKVQKQALRRDILEGPVSREGAPLR